MPRSLVLLIAFASHVTSLHAQPAAGAGDKQHQAVVLFERGLKHYNLAEYDAAIDLFKQAYFLTEAPDLLFNIAQSYRLKGPGNCRSALQFYRNYLRLSPATPKRASVEAAIKDMEICARSEPPQPDEPLGRDVPAPPAPPVPAVSAAAPAPSDSEQPHAPLLPRILVGAGAASAAIGGATLIWAWRRYESIKASGCAPSCDSAIVDPPRTGQHIGDVLVVAGVAAAAIGTVLWLTHRQPTRQQAWLAPVGTGVTLGMTF